MEEEKKRRDLRRLREEERQHESDKNKIQKGEKRGRGKKVRDRA